MADDYSAIKSDGASPPVTGASGSRNTPQPFPPPEAWMLWDFNQSQCSSCCRRQNTQPVLSASFIPKEADTFPQTYGPSGNAFESLWKILIHPAQGPGSNLLVILWGCNPQPLPLLSLTRCHSGSQRLLTKQTSKGASFPRPHSAEPAFPRISDVGRLFLKPSSRLFCHSDQTQRVGTLKLHRKREFKRVCMNQDA